MTKARLLEKLDAEVARWNRDVPVGGKVHWTGLTVTTRTPAFVHGSRSRVMIEMAGISPNIAVDLCEVFPIEGSAGVGA